jgi:hypothetical protein
LVGQPRQPYQQNEHLHVLGKRTVPPYTADTDIPGIAGFTPILFLLAYYDYKNRDDQGGSNDALSALNEAVGPDWIKSGTPGGLLGSLVREEVIQAAYNTRIIPADGFGEHDDYRLQNKCDPYGY